MERLVEPEWLDQLPADDTGAIGSRHDLKLLNAWMGNAGILSRAIFGMCATWTPRRIIELGAGDGNFLLRVAEHFPQRWKNAHAVLIDRNSIVSSRTLQRFRSLGWEVETLRSDLFDWLERSATTPDDLIVANLILH